MDADAVHRATLAELALTEGPLPGAPSPFLRSWIEAAVAWAPPEVARQVVNFYARDCVRAWAERFHGSEPETHALVRRDLREARSPRLAGALRQLLEGAREAGVAVEATWQAEDAAGLLQRLPRVIDLHASAFYGCCSPMVSLGSPERAALAVEHGLGWSLDEILDARIAAKIVHELCHGPNRGWAGGPGSWMLAEAAAAFVGLRCRPGHIHAELPGEPVLGLNTAMLLGHALVDDVGEAAVWRLALTGSSPSDVVGRRAGHALAAVDWQVWARRCLGSFLPRHDHMYGLAKLFDVSRDPIVRLPALEGLEDAVSITPELALAAPDLLAEVDQIPFTDLAVWHQQAVLDPARLGEAVRMLFQVERRQPDVQSCPADPPGGLVHLDVARCDLFVGQRADDAHGFHHQARFPPSLCRLLHARGLRRLVVAGATHARRRELVEALVDLCDGRRRLPARLELELGSSDRALLSVPTPPIPGQLRHADTVASVGCCLSRDLGELLAVAGFAVHRPVGEVLHDPLSSGRALREVAATVPGAPLGTWLWTWETAWVGDHLLSADEIVAHARQTLAELRAHHAEHQVVLAVSPVRQLGRGLVDSRRSKDQLLLAGLELAEEPGVQWFAAYEIVLDELRDARWFGPDRAHLTPQCNRYLFDRFLGSVVGPISQAHARSLLQGQGGLDVPALGADQGVRRRSGTAAVAERTRTTEPRSPGL